VRSKWHCLHLMKHFKTFKKIDIYFIPKCVKMVTKQWNLKQISTTKYILRLVYTKMISVFMIRYK